MAITNAKIGHQSPTQSIPGLRFKTVNTFTWGSGGNTAVVADEYCNANSIIVVNVTGTTPQAGHWAIVAGNQTFTITSSDSESSTLTVSYILL